MYSKVLYDFPALGAIWEEGWNPGKANAYREEFPPNRGFHDRREEDVLLEDPGRLVFPEFLLFFFIPTLAAAANSDLRWEQTPKTVASPAPTLM